MICEGRVGVGKRNAENAFFFEKFYRGHDLPHPRRSLYTPPVAPCAPAHPDVLHITGSSRTRAGKYQGRPPTQKLDTLHRSAFDTRQTTRGRSYRRQALECEQFLYYAYCDSSITSMVY